MQLDHVPRARRLVQPVDVLGDDPGKRARALELGDRAVAVVRRRPRHPPPADLRARPVALTRRRRAGELVDRHRQPARRLPSARDSRGSPIRSRSRRPTGRRRRPGARARPAVRCPPIMGLQHAPVRRPRPPDRAQLPTSAASAPIASAARRTASRASAGSSTTASPASFKVSRTSQSTPANPSSTITAPSESSATTERSSRAQRARSGEIQTRARLEAGTSPVRGHPPASAAGSTSERGSTRCR